MKKINLNRETIRNLSTLDLQNAMGRGILTDPCVVTDGCITVPCPISHPGKCFTEGGQCISAITKPC